MALTGSTATTARLWDLSDPNKIISYELQGYLKSVTSVSLTTDGRRALTGSDDTTARLWNLSDRNNSISYVLRGPAGLIPSITAVGSVSMTSDARWAAGALFDPKQLSAEVERIIGEHEILSRASRRV